MRRGLLFLLSSQLLSLPALSQVSQTELILLKQLDSVQNASSVSSHFASLYYNTTCNAIHFFLNKKEAERKFIQRLETRFASFFFRSSHAQVSGSSIPAEWRSYFSDTTLSPLQYKLLGINAHINGDIWQALTAEFSLAEIKKGRKAYFDFQKALKEEYKQFYAESCLESKKIKALHLTTAGLDKLYGQWMLKKWRQRQIRLAILYYTNKERFDKKLADLRMKMEHINRMVLQIL